MDVKSEVIQPLAAVDSLVTTVAGVEGPLHLSTAYIPGEEPIPGESSRGWASGVVSGFDRGRWQLDPVSDTVTHPSPLTAFITSGSPAPELRNALRGRLGRHSRRDCKLAAPELNGGGSACTSCAQLTLAARRLRLLGHHGRGGVACGVRTASNTANDLAGCLVVLIHSRKRRREQVFIRNFRGIRDDALSDQLSDYRVDDPYIQAHLDGPSSRSVLDLADSPTVLRDERS